MKQKTLIRDYTAGNVTRQLLLFAMPFMLSNLLQTVYNLVDMIVVGQFCGSVGLAAVSIGGDLLHLYTFFAMGFSSAGQIIISQYVGRKDRENVSRTVGTLFTFILATGLVLTVISLCLVKPSLGWMNTPDKAYSQAFAYSVICFSGLVFIFGYNMVSAVLRGMGDSRHPMIFIAVAAILNLILDLLFVAVLKMDAAGAALATVLGQGVSFIASLVFLYRRREEFGFDFRLKSFRPRAEQLKIILKLGIPMTLQTCAISISSLFVNSFINAYGVTVSAVTGVGNKLGSVASVVTVSLNNAGSSMIGQNFSIGNFDRCKKIVQDVFLFSVAFSAAVAVVMAIWPEFLFSLFNSDPDVLAMARGYAIIAILNFFGFASRAPALALVNGIGFANLNFFMGFVDGIVMRIGLAMLLGLVFDMGIMGFWLGSVLAGFAYFFVIAPYYLSGRWKKRRPVID